MGWRYVAYEEEDRKLRLAIIPMAKGPDRVVVADAAAWARTAPEWASTRRDEILARLRSIPWMRELEWCDDATTEVISGEGAMNPVPGSLESTRGGRWLERARMFHPRAPGHAQAHSVWHVAATSFAAQGRGRVTIFAEGAVPGSVFDEIELPALKQNPHVELVFIPSHGVGSDLDQ